MRRNEALSGFFFQHGKRAFISGEQGNICQILKGTGEQRQFWGTENIKKSKFSTFEEQGKKVRKMAKIRKR